MQICGVPLNDKQPGCSHHLSYKTSKNKAFASRVVFLYILMGSIDCTVLKVKKIHARNYDDDIPV